MTRARCLALPTALSLALSLALMASAADASPASSSASSAFAVNKKVGADQDEPWWHHAVIYQIYPRSFKDTNGDGLGDIKGITSELEYLRDIGVTAVWLSPFYPSPQADFGYDISNFKDVDPAYGTLEDFDEMVKKAHSLGMKVVVDLVPNHSSDEHMWFKESAKGTEKYKDYYVWSEGTKDKDGKPVPPNNWVSHFRGSAWTWNDERKAFYLHQFAVKQPDLNYRNPAVVQEMKDVFTFWMERGVNGFRVDALPFLFETQDLSQDELPVEHPSIDLDKNDYDYYTHPYTMDYPDTYDMLHQWRELVDNFNEDKRVIMTECYTTFDKTIEYYGTKDKLGAHFTFNFQLITTVNKSSDAKDFKHSIDQWMKAMDWRWPNWVIGNHDNSRVATRYPEMADAMNMISLTLPGTAMTYNGEELGMTDAFIRWDQTKDPQAVNAGPEKYLRVSRDPCRTPMQWDDTTSAGFSTNSNTWMPTNPNYYELNVKKELATPKSHLNIYKDLTEARKTETMRNGKLETAVLGENVLQITRSLENADTYITLVNMGSWEERVKTEALTNKGTLKVYTASVNSKLSKGATVPDNFVIRPKEAVVLTTGEASGGTSAATTVQAGILLALLSPLLCMLH
ncbi:Maltase A1 [Frankliniella fusca]|uniref:alpha-glucosidase n=2 Tax=Arthropoda TaxID=6656 RepID=A0AAE1LP03_9NEOP|nr:Maltase A1 [Frankliniella fusca]